MTLTSAWLLARIVLGVTIASVMLAVAAVSLSFSEGSVGAVVLGGAGAVLLWFSLTRRWATR